MDAWAQAVNPLQAAVEAGRTARDKVQAACLYQSSGLEKCCCSPVVAGVSPHGEVAEDNAFLRAALPNLLRAVVEGMEAKDLSWPGDTADMVVGLTYRGCVVYVDRASILSALTDAAGRVDAVTPDSHIGDHA